MMGTMMTVAAAAYWYPRFVDANARARWDKYNDAKNAALAAWKDYRYARKAYGDLPNWKGYVADMKKTFRKAAGNARWAKMYAKYGHPWDN